MGLMLRTRLGYRLHKLTHFLLRYLLLQTTKMMRSVNQGRERKHNRTQSIGTTHKLGAMSRPASVMNTTSMWKVDNLSIAPHDEKEQEIKQRVALLIFVGLWLLIFLIDCVLRCRTLLRTAERRRLRAHQETLFESTRV